MTAKTLLSMILLMSIGFFGCKPKDTDHIDGGVKKYNSGADSPKVIESSEITSFSCELSLFSADLEEDNWFAGRFYTLSATKDGESVSCITDWYERNGDGDKQEFIADVDFMKKLQEIAVKYDLAQYNGYESVVSGLPDMYGARLDIRYESGESIFAYDNQHCFIPADAVKELVEIFSAK